MLIQLPWTSTIVTVSPPPVLVSPSNGSSTIDQAPTFDWDDVSGATSYEIQIDSSQAIEVTQSTYTPNSDLSGGEHTWRVRSKNDAGVSAYTTSWTFTIVTVSPPPVLVSPSNGSSTIDQAPTFDWDDVSGATSYEIQIDSSQAIEVTESTYTPNSDLSGGEHTWRVRSKNDAGVSAYTTSWTFTIVTVSPPPVLASPSDGSSTINQTPTFDWDDVSGAISYEIQIDSSQAIEVTESTYTPNSDLSGGEHTWRVRSKNDAGVSAYTTSWTFTIVTVSPPPVLASPSDGSSTMNQTPTFDWDDVSGAISYEIQIDSSQAIEVTESTYTPNSDLSEGEHTWRVRSKNDAGVSAYTTSWTFTIVTVSPPPVLASPSDGSSTIDQTPTFDWDDVSGAISYEIQIDSSQAIEVTESTYTPNSDLSEVEHTWRVRSKNDAGTSSYTSSWTVKIVTVPIAPTFNISRKWNSDFGRKTQL